MCFSVNVNLVKEEIEQRYGVDFPGKYRYEPSYYYHAYSLPHLPAICSGNQRSVTMLRWGLIPAWVRSQTQAEEIRLKTFNARADSIATKPSFSESFRTMRCMIPVKGFFEWQHAGKVKIPWYIYLPDNQIITLAGLYSEWRDEGSGEIVKTFSIITTEANAMMAEIHNSKKRMPAMLRHEDEKEWIDNTTTGARLNEMLRPFPEELMKAHTISNLINNKSADKNIPDLIKPFNYSQPNLFF
jgi:putative SOS response-associated peptidase YedK